MKKYLFLLTLIVICNFMGYSQHLISNELIRQQVNHDYTARKRLMLLANKDLKDSFLISLNLKETEAFRFLYAYMPLNDVADHEAAFYLKNIRSSLKAQQYFAWGESIPENIFLHFVLPVRVNNEFLDSSRWVFFDELKERVKSLSMEQAILEVNHWCHEKVCYQGTDGRTSSPLCTIKTSFGRCGEESVLTVAALRAVGIPARQCYTPRWAHCDDNHAWVEVWVNENWHYIGACEPEATLDQAWFTAPAKRAMQVNTNVFGKYNGNEEVLLKGKYHTRINLIQQYAETKKTIVKVVNEKHQAIDSAQVLFCLYNYAEFYPLSKTTTNKYGECNLKTGLGDIIVWVSNNGKFNYAIIKANKRDTLVISPTKTFASLQYETFDLVPPPELPINESFSSELAKLNTARLHFEDSIRNNYMKTFPDSGQVSDFATGLGVDYDTLQDIITTSKGNWNAILSFLKWVPANRMPDAIGLLQNISDKDMRDCTSEVLKDHLLNFDYNPKYSSEINYKYILNPRISTEQLTAFRSFMLQFFGKGYKEEAQKNIQVIVKGILLHVTIDNEANYYNIPITPIGVLDVRSADKASRNILFVAMCRTMGIPARIETATLKPQYFDGAVWIDVFSQTHEVGVSLQGKLVINSDSSNAIAPQYSIHYSLAKLTNGNLQTLDYEESTLLNNLPATLNLDTGSYVMITGSRLKDGSVLASMQPFRIRNDSYTKLTILLRKPSSPNQSLGKINVKQGLSLEEKANTSLSSLHWGVDVIVSWVVPDAEPTKHLFAELQQYEKQMNTANTPVVLLVQNQKEADALKDVLKRYQLPSNVFVGIDDKLSLLKTMELKDTNSAGFDFPVVTVVTPEGDMLYHSKGYQIGSVERMLQVLK